MNYIPVNHIGEKTFSLCTEGVDCPSTVLNASEGLPFYLRASIVLLPISLLVIYSWRRLKLKEKFCIRS